MQKLKHKKGFSGGIYFVLTKEYIVYPYIKNESLNVVFIKTDNEKILEKSFTLFQN
jgi:hypothetical protein